MEHLFVDCLPLLGHLLLCSFLFTLNALPALLKSLPDVHQVTGTHLLMGLAELFQIRLIWLIIGSVGFFRCVFAMKSESSSVR